MAETDGGPAFPVKDLNRDGTVESQHDGMTLLDRVALAAMQSLILKVPLHDRQGEHGIKSPTIEEIHQVRIDIAESAFDYAAAFVAEKFRREEATT